MLGNTMKPFDTGRGGEMVFGRRDGDHDGFVSKQEFLPVSAASETR
jgi:hypothetical protein